MSYEEFLNHLETMKLEVHLESNQLELRGPKDAFTPELKELTQKYQARLVGAYRRGELSSQNTPSASRVPLSWFQERLWIHYLRAPEDLSYNLPVLLEVRGRLNVPALRRSLQTILTRQESLRTRYGTHKNGHAFQVVDPPTQFELPVQDVASDEVGPHIQAVVEHHFDLENGPVFLARLLRLQEHSHLLLINFHHIATDAWSIKGVFFRELQQSYAAYALGRKPELTPLTWQYRHFATWQREQELSSGIEYWRKQLDGYDDTLELPTDGLRQADSGKESEEFVHKYDATFVQKLERFAQAHGSTLFMALVGALGVLVHRVSGREDLCLGTTTSGRNRVELEGLIGFFINILPLRFAIDESQTVEDFMRSTRNLTLNAFDHQMVPFEQILHQRGVSGSGNTNPLVPVIIRHQNFPHTNVQTPLPGGITFMPYSGASDDEGPKKGAAVRARCEIELSFTGAGGELELEVAYASDLYKRESIERLLAQHQHLLEQMFDEPQRLIGDLDPLTDADRKRLLFDLNATEVPLEGLPLFPARFSQQVGRTPDAACCIEAERVLSYLEVETHSNQLAHVLVERGLRRDEIVGVCLERGASLLICLLGVWKAGAAYLPLDPAYPKTYLQEILDSAEPRLILSTSEQASQLPPDRLFLLDEEEGSLSQSPSTAVDVQPKASDLAYLMYTSGSTGLPKGVRVPHRQLINWLAGIESRWPFLAGEVIAQKTTAAFAPSVKEIFAGLLNGSALVFFESETVRDPAALCRALREHRVSRMNLVPSHLLTLLSELEEQKQELPALRILITAGEPLTAEVVAKCRCVLPHVRLLNNYGCTELNDIAYYDASDYRASAGFVPIGRPIQNTKLYVLDRHGRLVPPGVSGELHVASLSMSAGYHRNEELTRERYLPNPFDDGTLPVLFNTGDVVRYLPDGNLDYLGRWDFQVKVRGFRVDVRHVEKVLGDFAGLGQRAVVGDGERLAAFYVPQPEQIIDAQELRAFVRERLPAHMVPDAFVALEKLPQLPNGKLNRRALRVKDALVEQSADDTPPKGEVELALQTIWAEVLDLPRERLGRHAHFFETGGHSLSATRVVVRVKDRFAVELKLSAIFEQPLLHQLAQVIEESPRAANAKEGKWSLEIPHEADQASPSRLLEGKVALVTGASRGIGQAIALLLAQNGARVAINYRESERQAQAVRDLIVAGGGKAELFQADVTDSVQVDKMVEQVRRSLGPIDVLVANASIAFSKRAFLESTWDTFEQKVTGELKAIFFPCQAVVADMLHRQKGSVIAVSSGLSKHSNLGFSAQSTAKAALDAFVRSLAEELGPQGIRVNTVAPGITLTDGSVNMSQAHKDASAAICPLRRSGTPQDMAGAVLFLASDLSRFMTGSYLPVDGGFTML